MDPFRPKLKSKDYVLSIHVSDLHFSHKPPTARSAEESWYEAMGRQIDWLVNLAGKYRCPIVVAGDFLHHYDEPAALLNFLINRLRGADVYSIPGNHDLPGHSWKERKRSAYWTLVEAGAIKNIPPRKSVEIPGTSPPVRLWGWPCGFPIEPCPNPCDLAIEVAVIHAFVWVPGKGFPGAPEENRVRAYKKKLKNWDVAHFGDNHLTVHAKAGRCVIWNPGSFLRRNADEKDRVPQVGLLRSDGSVTPVLVPVSDDKWLKKEAIIRAEGVDVGPLLKAMEGLDDKRPDFCESVRRWLEANRDKLSGDAWKAILELLEDER